MSFSENAKALIRKESYINGIWVEADNGSEFEVINPANQEIIAKIANLGGNETEKAVQAAEEALKTWKHTLAKDRANLLREWAKEIRLHTDALAEILTIEQGKPLLEAKSEIQYGLSFIDWFAEETRRTYGDIVPTHKKDARIMLTRQPIGVVGAITPWNHPNAMIARKVSPALAAGCTVVLKPSEETPLSAIALTILAEKAGFPKGVFNLVVGDNASQIGTVLTQHPVVKKISFTGSTAVGKKLMAQVSSTVKKVSLELGGNAPFIVFESADLDKAVQGAIDCKFRNAGQTCVSANRIYVHDAIYERFVDKFTKKVNAMKVGNGMDEGVKIGPLIYPKAVDKVAGHVKDAIDKGATLLCGGTKPQAVGNFYQPTVLTRLTQTMAIAKEETFGPIAGLFKFSNEDEVIKWANDTLYGLAAYVYTRDFAQIFRTTEALEYGMVAVNEPYLSAEAAPFGGIKESGIGREGSRYGLEEFTEIKYTLIGGL